MSLQLFPFVYLFALTNVCLFVFVYVPVFLVEGSLCSPRLPYGDMLQTL